MEKTTDTIILGSYLQNEEKKTPLEWIVLKQEFHRILCVSKFLIDCKPYNTTLEDVTWENCSLRKWLNKDFLITAFTDEEQRHIMMTDIKTPFQDTKDHIFLLSVDEAEEYLDFEIRAAKTTKYARMQGAWFIDDDNDKYGNHGTWWLRYPEEDEEESAFYTVLSCVNFDGYIEGAADQVTAKTCCVRPAFWLNMENS